MFEASKCDILIGVVFRNFCDIGGELLRLLVSTFGRLIPKEGALLFSLCTDCDVTSIREV